MSRKPDNWRLPPEFEDWPEDTKRTYVDFTFRRDEQLEILATAFDFETPEPDRRRLTTEELAAIIIGSDALQQWQLDRMQAALDAEEQSRHADP